jgi:hypothetical protein
LGGRTAIADERNGLPFRRECDRPPVLTGGLLGRRRCELDEAMSAHFPLNRATFRERPAWRLEQSAGSDLLPFAVHHRRVREAVVYAQQVSGLMRCVVELEGRHRVVCQAKGLNETAPDRRAIRS